MATEKTQTKWFDSLDDASQFLRLFDFLPEVHLYVKDAMGRFVAVNQTFCAAYGTDCPEELLGKTDVDLHPIYWGRRYQEEDRRVMDSGEELPHQVWLVPTRRGGLGTFISSKIPLRDRTGSVIGIAGVMQRIDQELEPTSTLDPIDIATQIINERYAAALTMTDIASEIGLSVSQLNRRFRKTHQIPPSEYLQRVRVYQASRLLAQGGQVIGDVALRCGFYDQAHLNRTFRKWMKMTPNEFRVATQTRKTAPTRFD